ncbi:MAG: carboxypeptidase-like regulatory domain-containing protein [Cyclobacteriaceae bacterium]|nr:carboxypeptidase-like regulatory domain-containing protein [Cyclobacteriaceae bacterium]
MGWPKWMLTGMLGIITGILPAQIHTVTGVVKDQPSGSSLSYVNIWITGTPLGTSSNADGAFEIKIPASLATNDNTLSFSSIGYVTQRFPLASLIQTTNITVRLEPAITNLSELVIITARARKKNANRARKLVQQALNKVPKNYPKKSYRLNTFYRHYCSENNNYVRLIEAAVDVYSPKNEFDKREIPDERLSFGINQLRRSFDFTENAKIFHPAISLNFLWTNDFTDFAYHNPLSGPLLQYQFQVIDTSNLGNEKVYVVDFEDNRPIGHRPQTWYQGRLYILKKDLAFIKAEIEELKQKSGARDSVYSVIRKTVTFKNFKNKYFIDRLTSDVNVFHATVDSNSVVLDTLRHKSHIEMISNNIITDHPEEFFGKEPGKIDLRKILYDSTFWDQYTVLKATKLESKIIQDLSEKISLQQQFAAFNTVEGGGISILESERFRKLLTDHSGKPLYVVLWSNWGHLNYLELEPISYFKRMLKKDKVKLLLVAIEENESDWMNNRKFYGLDNPMFSHERITLGFDSEIAQSYLNNVFPYFVSVTRDGEILSQEPPLPNAEEIKPYIKSLIQDNIIADQ